MEFWFRCLHHRSHLRRTCVSRIAIVMSLVFRPCIRIRCAWNRMYIVHYIWNVACTGGDCPTAWLILYRIYTVVYCTKSCDMDCHNIAWYLEFVCKTNHVSNRTLLMHYVAPVRHRVEHRWQMYSYVKSRAFVFK
jgi:hypothetical protein